MWPFKKRAPKVEADARALWSVVLIRREMLEASPQSNLFFAVVLVPSENDKLFQYHILTHSEACDLFSQQRKVKKDGTPYKPGMDGLSWGQVKPHRDAWGKLPV